MKYEVFGTNTKKMLNMLILEILRMYSDEQHPLTQQEISGWRNPLRGRCV